MLRVSSMCLRRLSDGFNRCYETPSASILYQYSSFEEIFGGKTLLSGSPRVDGSQAYLWNFLIRRAQFTRIRPVSGVEDRCGRLRTKKSDLNSHAEFCYPAKPIPDEWAGSGRRFPSAGWTLGCGKLTKARRKRAERCITQSKAHSMASQ